MTRRWILLFVVAAVTAGCQADPTVSPSSAGKTPTAVETTPPAQSPAAVTTTPAKLSATSVTVVASGLEVPWAMAPLPGGGLLVTERGGQIAKVLGNDVTPLGSVSGVESGGESGLLGIALSPSFATDKWVYAYLTTATEGRVVRMQLEGNRLGPAQLVIGGWQRAAVHDGGAIAFGPDGLLYIATGDAGVSARSQDTASLNGKILRVTAEGAPAAGNPFPDSAVYSYGHRNVEGLAFDSAGRLWATEFGANKADELNQIVAGSNYGWPLQEGGGPSQFRAPELTWATKDASPAGLAIVGEGEQQVAVVACLRGQRVWLVPISGGKVTGEAVAGIAGEYGRLRGAMATSGGVLISTSNRDGRGSPADFDDRILRVTIG